MGWKLCLILFLLLNFVSADLSAAEAIKLDVVDEGQNGVFVSLDLTQQAGLQLEEKNSSLWTTQLEGGEEIPVINKYIAVPEGMRARAIVSNRESFAHWIDNIDLIGGGANLEAEQLDQNLLDPPQPFSIGRIEIVRGIPIAPISIFPIQYDRVNDRVIENRVIGIDISFESDQSVPIPRPLHLTYQSEHDRMISKLLLNSPRRDPEYIETQQSHRGRILILHRDSEQFREDGLEHVDRLANWKRAIGYRVEIVAVPLEGEERMTVQEIRTDLIRERYFSDDPLGYVILIGDTETDNISFPAYTHERWIGDHFYSLMDDMDEEYERDLFISDIAVGRIEVNSYNKLRWVIERTVLYEEQPFVEEGDDWMVRGIYTAEGIGAPEGQFVQSMIHLGRWINLQLRDYGFVMVDTVYIPDANAELDQYVRDVIAGGVSLAMSRGWLLGCLNDDADEGVDTGRKNPLTFAVTCLSHPRMSTFFQSASSARDLRGPIGTLSLDGLSHSKPNNSLLGGSVLGITDYNISQIGLIQNFGKFQFWSDDRYQIGENDYENIAIYRLMGDPTTQVFTKRPITLTAELPATIDLETRGLSIFVSSEEEEEVPGAWVTVWQPGGVHLVCQPGEDGFARFTFEEEDLAEGALNVTITRPNALPVHDEIEVREFENMVELTEVEFNNEDGLFGYGEVVSTVFTVRNTSDDSLGNLVFMLSTDYELVGFSVDEFNLEGLAANEESQLEFDLEFDGASKFGRTIRIQLDITNGDDAWEHAIEIASSGQSLSVTGDVFPDNNFDPGNAVNITPPLLNIGDMATPAMNAELESLSPYIEVEDAEGRYAAINVDNVVDLQGTFRVNVHELAIAGNTARFRIILTPQNEEINFIDTVYFEETIGNPNENDPYGPDEYGYIVFDSSDEDWEKCPVYEWIEINPFKDGGLEGERIELNDLWDGQDTTIAVELPFPFRFYGEQFDTVVVNSNGWLAFGAENSLFVDFRNEQIPGMMGPNSMVAAFWQDLINPNPERRGVFHHYLEEEAIFIIEWSEMAFWRGNLDSMLTEFQAILYDPRVYPTSTGDGEIKLQYKTVQIFPGDHSDNQYMTVGIKNNDGTDGLEYTYWNEYPVNNLNLQDEMALFFTTDRISSFGRIEGRITHRDSLDIGIEGVDVITGSGAGTMTDENGNFEIDPVPTGVQIITLEREHYNSLEAEVTVEFEQVARFDTSLTHPVIVASDDPVTRQLTPGSFRTTISYRIENDGNGPIDFSLLRRYTDGSDTEYGFVNNWDVSTLVNDDTRIWGCQFIADSVFITAGGEREAGDEQVHVFDSNMELQRSFRQPCQSGLGFYDLAWDGNLIWGGEQIEYEANDSNFVSVSIIGFDKFTGEIQSEIDLPELVETLDEPYALAWNPNDSNLIVTNRDKDVYVISREGEIIRQFSLNLPGVNLDVRGLSWNEYDEDGMQLYIIDNPPQTTGMRLIKANYSTGEAELITDLGMGIQSTHIPTGLSISYGWDLSQTFVGTIVNPGGARNADSLRIHEIGPNTNFLSITPNEGMIDGHDFAQIEMEIRGENLIEGTYEFSIVVEHNAAGESIIIPITVHAREGSVGDSEDGLPISFSLENAYPNPFNNATRISFSIVESGKTSLLLYDVHGRMVEELINQSMKPGRYNVVFTPQSLSSGIYFYRLVSTDNVATKRLVFLK